MLRKVISVLLSVILIIGVFAIVPFSASADSRDVISYCVGSYSFNTRTDGSAYFAFDGKEFDIDDAFDPGSIGSKLPHLKNQNVVYELHNSKIAKVYSIDEVIYPKITVSHSDTEELYYKDGKFSCSSFELQVNITPQLSEQFLDDDLLWFLSDIEKERLFLNLTGMKITTPYGADFGSSGFAFWKSYTDEINENYNDDIKVNETKTYRYTVNLRNDKVFSQTEYTMDFDVTPKFDFGDSSSKTAKIQIVNLDEYAAIAEAKKASSPSGKAEKAAADTLSLKGNLVTASTTWNNYFTNDQSRQLDEFAYVWVSDLILAEIIDYSQFDLKTELAKKVQQEVLSKLGIDEKIITTGTKLSGSVNLLTETKDGTEVLVNYVADLSSFKFGLFSSDRPFGVTGQLKLSVYRISDGSQMGMTETVIANYTDIDAFIENLQAIAKSTIFNIGKDVYGLSATKAANAITDGLMTKALNSKSNCFSVASRLTSKQKSVIQKVTSKAITGELKKCNETVFKLLTTPSRSAKLHRFECPVNVRVYDNAGNYCGGIINGQVDSLYHEVFATVNGEAKDFYTIGDDYYFVVTGYDAGTMKYTVKEFDDKGEIRKLSYENVPIHNSCVYYSMSPQTENMSNVYSDLVDNEGNSISPTLGQDDSDVDPYSDYIISSGNCGTNVSYTIYKDGLLEITGKGDMDDYVQPEDYDDYPSYYRNPWDKYKENIRQIIIGEGVTSIGANAFTNFDSVETVIMPESVKKICVGAFSYCSGITSLIIPDSITEIQKSAFYGCEQLESVDISNSVSKIGRYTFENCSSLSNIKIGDSVETICESAFENCPNITKIIIPGSVKYIESLAFYDCKIDCVDIQDLDSWCDIKFYSESSNPLSCADHLCIKGERITKLVIPTNVTEIKNYAFTGCKSITDLSVPNNVASIGSGAFCNCTSLINISIPDSVTEISDSLFSGCTNLISLVLPDSITKIGSSSFSQCTSLTDIVFPDKLTIIGRSSFYNCKNLKNVTIPPSVSKIDSGAFHDCTNITDVKIYDIKAWCSIEFAQYDSNPLYYAKNLFVKNTLSNNLIIPENVSNIKDNAFYGFVGLKGITIPDSVTKIEKYSFYGCSSLEYIKTGNGIKDFTGFQFGLSNKYSNLQQIIIGNSIESLDDCMFYRCTHLKSVVIGDSISSISRQSFDSCSEIEYISLPESITRIETYAFSDCANLRKISIPNSVTDIEYRAFNHCNNLSDVYFSGSKQQWDSISINTGNECLLNANIHYSETIPSDYSEIFLNKNLLSLEVGQTEYLIPFVFPDNVINNTITWSSSNTNIAIVDNGRVTGIKAGETTITAKTNNGKTDTCTVLVNTNIIDPTGIALNQSNLSLVIGKNYTLSANVLPSNATDKTVTWSSSDSEVARVINGKVTAYKTGTATISATTSNGKSASCIIIVIPDTDTSGIVGDSDADGSITIMDATCVQYFLSYSPISDSFKWLASDTDRDGDLSITDATYIQRYAAGMIDNFNHPESISLNTTSKIIGVGNTFTLNVSFTPSNVMYREITWESSNNNVATVNNGKVTAKTVGTATITATTYNGKQAKCNITVAPVPNSVTLNSSSISLDVGGTYQLSATVSPSDANDKTVSWSSNNSAVATVDSNGKITANSSGSATITATTSNGKKASCMVNVKNIEVSSVSLNSYSITLDEKQTYQLSASVYPSNATNKTITWSINNSSIATVNNSGKVTAISGGVATITAKSNNGKTASCIVTVNGKIMPESIEVLPKVLTLAVGNTYELNAKITPNNAEEKSVTWSSSNTNAVSVDSNGKLVANKAGMSATITARTVNGLTSTVKVDTVEKASQYGSFWGLGVKYDDKIYSVPVSKGPLYVSSSGDDLYFISEIDSEIYIGATLNLYITSGSSGVYDTQSIPVSYSTYDITAHKGYIPISQYLNTHKGQYIRVYTEVVLAKGQVVKPANLGTDDAIYLYMN